MTENANIDQVTRIMKNCSSQLRIAHADLSRCNVPVGPLAKISGVADALDSLKERIVGMAQEAEQARRTAGGLTVAVGRLRNQNR